MAKLFKPAVWLPLAALVLAPIGAHALQVIDGRDGVAVEAIVSQKEPTRIRIDGMPISDVFGNIYSSNCAAASQAAATPSAPTPAVNPAGELVLECDRDKGEVYVRPVGASTKPINLFVSSAQATYTLILRRSDVPADTIVIRDKNARKNVSDDTVTPFAPAGRAAGHIRALKALLLTMTTDRLAPDVRVDDVHIVQPLWAEVTFTLQRLYEGHGLIGEKYLLTNISAAPMVLAEQEFDRDDGNVAAIAVDNLNLRPGESTYVYVIRIGG